MLSKEDYAVIKSLHQRGVYLKDMQPKWRYILER